MSVDNQVYDVLIVGAGPVGLATAIALHTNGINNILVIDQTRSFRRVGQVVDLLPNGLKSLKAINEKAYHQIKEFGLQFMQIPQGEKKFWYFRNLDGEIVRSIPLDFDYWCEHYGEGRVSIPWFELQTHLRNLLPPEMIKINNRCVDLTHKTDSIVIDCISNREIPANPFAHWETINPDEVATSVTENLLYNQFQAKLVVAADGINSTIRKITYTNSKLEHWAKPQYSGFYAVGCLEIANIPSEIIQELESKYWQGQRVVTIDSKSYNEQLDKYQSIRLMLIRKGNNSLGYLCHLPLDLDFVQKSSEPNIIDTVVNTLTQANFPSVLTKSVALSHLDKLIIRPYYIHPVNIFKSEPIWSQGRLVLAGDAAHGMPPFMAQGGNQGLEDAAVIGAIITKIIKNNDLDNLETITTAFHKYEELRRPFLEKIQTATMENNQWEQQEWEQFSEDVYSRDLEDLINNFTENFCA